MHTITPAFKHPRSRRAFTLVEMLVSTALSAVILIGILSSVLFIAKGGFLLNNYIEMESEARAALETFAVDARMTEDVTWSRDSVTSPLTVLTLVAVTGDSVTYTYNSAAGTLSRAAGVAAAQTMISGIQSFTFTAYRYDSEDSVKAMEPATYTIASLNNETKMVQISLSAIRSQSNLSDATNNVVSARFVLRNKRRGT